METNNNLRPKVFISYSWNPESNKQKVLDLARRLTGDGVFVIIDEWDLSKGNDKNVFMEQMVNDSTVKKVLVICNKEYSEKANNRKGGVGIEGTIISSEVYNKANQTKFIPIVFEFGPDGDAYLPIFLKQTIYIDLCSIDVYEDNYDQLLRCIYDKPKSSRPPIGNMPSYLSDKEPTYLPTANKVRAINNALLNNSRNTLSLINDYLKSFLDSLLQYKIDYQSLSDTNFIDIIEQKINEMIPLKDDFIDFLFTIIDTEYCTSDLLISFFEKILSFYEEHEINLDTANYLAAMANDNYRYFNQDLFTSLATILFTSEKYNIFSDIVKGSFLVASSYHGRETIVYSFSRFRQYNYTLDEYKNNRQSLNKISIVGEEIKKHSGRIKFSDMVQVDLLLYYLSLMQQDKHDYGWYPSLNCYNQKNEVLPQLMSRRHFAKLKVLFGVNSEIELKNMIDNVKHERHSRYEMYIPDIKMGLCYDKICSYA